MDDGYYREPGLRLRRERRRDPFFDESDDLFGKRGEIERHDGPVVLGARSIRSIPPDLRKNLVVVKAPQPRWWQRLLRSD